MSLASVSAQQTSASTGSAATTSSSATSGSQSGSSALNSLSSNFGDFLSLLMTQLQNQDPTSPLDTNEFTTELVQFSSVEQQINTNSSLTQLIQLTQAGEMMQASSMTGKQVTVSSDHVPLQNGKGTIQFTAPSNEMVDIATSALTFSVVGTATGVQNQSSGIQLQMGALSVDFSKVQSVGN